VDRRGVPGIPVPARVEGEVGNDDLHLQRCCYPAWTDVAIHGYTVHRFVVTRWQRRSGAGVKPALGINQQDRTVNAASSGFRDPAEGVGGEGQGLRPPPPFLPKT